eukprot:gene5624-5863_t
MVMACGSNDRTMTIWVSELALPLMHCSQVHKGPIVDVAWTPDGYSLITTSNEDSIVVFRWDRQQLGQQHQGASCWPTTPVNLLRF